ncbi:MAG: glycosyltransferase family 4 protein [Planctomycetes bacterium]|nr:glycosyltransferase family 4 protein [Planctomycetota bacterium]
MTRGPRLLVSGVVLGQPMGGVRLHNREILPRLAHLLEESGGSLAVLEGRDRIEFALPASVEIIHTNVPMHPIVLRAEAELRALRKALRTAHAALNPFDLVHTAHMPAPRGLDVPYTLTIHDLRSVDPNHGSAPRRVMAERVLRSAIKHALRVFTVSRFVASQIQRSFQPDGTQIVVVPNGVDHFTPLPRRPEANAPIRCIGHLEQRKNIELVIRALAVDKTLPRLEVHGAPKGEELERLRGVAAEMGVKDRVTFAGAFADDELPRLLASAACVCVPSRIEGFGITALEAQRAAVPLAITRGTALTEVAGDKTPNFAPTDPSECAHALHAALAAPAVEIERARARADLFTWDASARAWFDGIMNAR